MAVGRCLNFVKLKNTVPLGYISNRALQFAICAALSLSYAVSSAQYVSKGGRFQVDQVKGCAPFTITITNANLITTGQCQPGTNCIMTYETAGLNNVFTYTYANPGTYTLSVLYPNIGSDEIDVTVVSNIQPDFEIYSCSGDKVSVKVLDKNYEQYYINFGDGSPLVGIPSSNNQVASHNYPGSATYPISIRGKDLSAADNCSSRTENFDAIATLPVPVINTLTCLDANSVQLDFSAAPHLELRLEIATNSSSAWQPFNTLYGVSTDTAQGLQVDNNYYCFRLDAFDPCTGTHKYSNTICSQKFSAIAQSDVNQLSWLTSATGINTYNIARDNASYKNVTVQSYNDVNIVCKTDYCYQITSKYSNGSNSISLQKCITAFTNKVPTAIGDASAVVTDTQASLSWVQPPNFIPVEYKIRRSSGGGNFEIIGSSASENYDDPGYSTGNENCYQVTYQDQCDNFSVAGITICPIRLTGAMDNRNAISLSWSDYEGWTNGVKYYILEKYNQAGALVTKINTGTVTTYLDDNDAVNQVVSYRVVAHPNDIKLALSSSNTIRFTRRINLFFPTAFTPNNDQLNDRFSVNGQFIKSLELNIFDRWGNLVFSGENDASWDGTYGGKLMPESTYVWKAIGTDVAGQAFTQFGSLVLLHKK